MFAQIRKRLVYVMFGAVFMMGGAKAAYAECWAESGGVMCAICGVQYCCVQWYQNGTCCEPTIEHCEEI